MCFAEIQHSLNEVLAIPVQTPTQYGQYNNEEHTFLLQPLPHIWTDHRHSAVPQPDHPAPTGGFPDRQTHSPLDIYHRNIKFSTSLQYLRFHPHLPYGKPPDYPQQHLLQSRYTVDNLVRLNFCHYFFYSLTVCYIHLCNINADTFTTSSQLAHSSHHIKAVLYACH